MLRNEEDFDTLQSFEVLNIGLVGTLAPFCQRLGGTSALTVENFKAQGLDEPNNHGQLPPYPIQLRSLRWPLTGVLDCAQL